MFNSDKRLIKLTVIMRIPDNVNTPPLNIGYGYFISFGDYLREVSSIHFVTTKFDCYNRQTIIKKS